MLEYDISCVIFAFDKHFYWNDTAIFLIDVRLYLIENVIRYEHHVAADTNCQLRYLKKVMRAPIHNTIVENH